MRGQYLKSDSPELLFLSHSINAPQNADDGDFRRQHPYAAAVLGFTLVGAGEILALPAVVAAVLERLVLVRAEWQLVCFFYGSFPFST